MILNNPYIDAYFSNGMSEVLLPEVTSDGNVFTVRIPKEQIADRVFSRVCFRTADTVVTVPADGYLFYPAGFAEGCGLSYFTKRQNCRAESRLDALSFAGIGG